MVTLKRYGNLTMDHHLKSLCYGYIEFFEADLKMAKISRLRVDLHCSYHIHSPWIFSKNTGGCPYMVLTRVPQKFSKFQIN